MDLSSIPKDACPLCGQVALDRTGTLWQCRSCGCKLEFDPRTRRSRIVHFPDDYAAFEGMVGSVWLTRREMFERVEAAQQAQAAAEGPGSGQLFGPILVVTLILTVACVILATIATALVISPSLARTRRAISAAYQPTATAGPAVTMTMPAEVSTPDSQSDPQQPTPAAEPNQDEPPPPALQMPPPEPPQPPQQPPLDPVSPPAPPPLNSPLPDPRFATEPTPAPPVFQPTVAAPPTETPTPEAPATPTALVLLPTDTPPAATPPPPPTPSTPDIPGSLVFQGTVRIRLVRPVGSGPGQPDEYVELYNEGTQQVNLDGWSLRAVRTADNTVIATYLFGNGAVIAAQQICRIYTNLPFAPDDCGFSGGFASPEPIWPDSGGARASLFNQGNIEYARFTY